MLLTDIVIAGDSEKRPVNLGIYGGQFVNSSLLPEDTPVISIKDGIAYPGFINSHDHLDFNLFPQLGNRIYANYREWGKDIQANNRDSINAILQIPELLRIQWGMYKNLLNGFTTVVNHGKELDIDDPFVHVYQGAHSMHSPGFEKDWRWKLNDPFNKKRTVAMHVGEGTDALSHEEISTLVRSNLLQKKLVAIHGVAMNTEQAKKFSALVWCPSSNHFLLGRTADISALKKHTAILFGSDSTLTADWNTWKHFDKCQATLTQNELIAALTITAADVWGLNNRGRIEENKQADLVIVKPPANDQLINGPEDVLLLLQDGSIKLFDDCLHGSLNRAGIDCSAFTKIICRDRYKYVYGNIAQLVKETRRYNPDISLPITLADA